MQMTHPEEGLRKLIYSDQAQPDVEVGMRLIQDPAKLVKSAASTIFGCGYDELMPDKDHVGIHVVALGDFEHYGANRNGDSFPKRACIDHHATFVTHGHVFIGHNNHDPENAVGKIVKSAFNEPMGRIELFMHVDKDKAASQLHRLEKEGTHPFSMACKVPFDRCNSCNCLRKSAADPNQCAHVRDQLGHTLADGTLICTHNDTPTFFDDSFVDRPADRIAWHLKVASENQIMDSVKLAEAEGIWVPDELEYDIPGYQRKLDILKKLAEAEVQFLTLIASPHRETHRDKYMWELQKAAAYDLDDATIGSLRNIGPERLFDSLAHAGVVLSAPLFYKYALGIDYGAMAPDMAHMLEYIRSGLFNRLYKTGAYQRICRNVYFDVDMEKGAAYGIRQTMDETKSVANVAAAGAYIGQDVDGRIITATVCDRKPELAVLTMSKSAENNPGAERAAEIYAAYKVSAIDSVLAYHKQANEDVLLALAAIQNLVK